MECFSVDAFNAELSINITLSIHQQRGGTILFENIHFSSTQFELLKAKNRIVVFRRKYRKHSVWQVKNYLWEGFEKIDKFIWKSPYCWMVWNPREERERVMVYVVRRLFCEMTTPGWGGEERRGVMTWGLTRWQQGDKTICLDTFPVLVCCYVAPGNGEMETCTLHHK